MTLPPLRDRGVILHVRIRTSARASRIVGILEDGTMQIAIAAEAQENEANRALIRFLSKQYGVPQASVTILRGMRSKTKTVAIAA